MEEVPWYVSLFVSWLPFMVWVAIGIWMARRISRSIDGHAREARRTNDILEQTLASHTVRLEALEKSAQH